MRFQKVGQMMYLENCPIVEKIKPNYEGHHINITWYDNIIQCVILSNQINSK